VENWCVNTFSNISSVLAGSSLVGSSGETNLVVDNDMDSTANGVVSEGLHLNLFVNNALAGHCGVTVHNDWHYSSSVLDGATKRVLLRTCSAHHHGVNSFQVGGVSHESNCDLSVVSIALLLLSSV